MYFTIVHWTSSKNLFCIVVPMKFYYLYQSKDMIKLYQSLTMDNWLHQPMVNITYDFYIHPVFWRTLSCRTCRDLHECMDVNRTSSCTSSPLRKIHHFYCRNPYLTTFHMTNIVEFTTNRNIINLYPCTSLDNLRQSQPIWKLHSYQDYCYP
jgi:hypothetical protein